MGTVTDEAQSTIHQKNYQKGLDRYGKVAFLPDTDTDPLRCTVNVKFEGYAMVLLYKDP